MEIEALGVDWAGLDIEDGGNLAANLKDYGSLFADNVDWLELQDSLVDNIGQDLTYPDFPAIDEVIGPGDPERTAQEPVEASNPVPEKPAAAQKTGDPPSQREFELLKQIEDLGACIREHELLESSAAEILPLQQERNTLQLELRQLKRPQGSLRDANLVSLELEKAVLRLDQLRSTLPSEAYQDDEERAELDWRRIRLKKELGELKKQPRLVPAEGEQTTIASQLESPASHKIANNAPQASSKRPYEVEGDSTQITWGSETPATTLVQQYAAGTGSMSIFRLSTPANKKPRRSQRQTQNRKDVVEAGGQCLSCRANRSKPACLGDRTCSQCQKDGLECIRPTLKDKNVFIEKLDFTYQPIHSSESSAKRIRFDFVAAITNDFFDFSGHRFLKRNPDVLPLVDNLYAKLVEYGFNPEVSASRKAALSGPCVFNIFVKANTVVCNQHLWIVDDILEDHVRTKVEIDIMENPSASEGLSADDIQLKVFQTVENKKAEIIRNFVGLRGLASQYFFLVLEEILSDASIRKAKQDLARKASLLAVVGLTLENVLEFADSASRTKMLDANLKRLLRHLGLVLLSYLQPPSYLAFPKETPINQCFGSDPNSVVGVYFEDSFWYELYKASRAALPAHLLQVTAVPGREPEAPEPVAMTPRPPSAQQARQAHQDRLEHMSRDYLGMNLDFRGPNINSSYDPGTSTEFDPDIPARSEPY